MNSFCPTKSNKMRSLIIFVGCLAITLGKLIRFYYIYIVYNVSDRTGKTGFGPTDQDWGFEEVRNGSYLFWWLHYTNATPNYLERPLIIWLQGGPGGSSTG